VTTFTDKISKFKNENMPDVLGADIKSPTHRHATTHMSLFITYAFKNAELNTICP